jgi:hypothetical protein
MLVHPSVVGREDAHLNILYEGAAVLRYWRAGVAVTADPRVQPPAPIGCVIVAWVPQRFNQFRYPCRIFYLSCMGPGDYHDGVDFNESSNLVFPPSIEPGKPAMTRPTKFGRDQFVGSTVDYFRNLCADNRKEWEKYAQTHGVVLPSHVEDFDGQQILD